MIKLAKLNLLKFIYLLTSQNNESMFRCARTHTRKESMAVNCTMHSFISRIQKIQTNIRLELEMAHKDCEELGMKVNRVDLQQILKTKGSQGTSVKCLEDFSSEKE